MRVGLVNGPLAMDWALGPSISRIDRKASGWMVADGIMTIDLEIVPP